MEHRHPVPTLGSKWRRVPLWHLAEDSISPEDSEDSRFLNVEPSESSAKVWRTGHECKVEAGKANYSESSAVSSFEILASRAVLLRQLNWLLDRAERSGNVPLLLQVLRIAAELSTEPAA